MLKRFVSIWFPFLATDWFSNRQPYLRKSPFVLRAPSHGRMIITAANQNAIREGVSKGMVLADARAAIHNLQVLDDQPHIYEKLIHRIAEWCIRFTPVVAVDLPDGLFFDATGCAHLWGGEEKYLNHIVTKFNHYGYSIRIAMADTPGAAWGEARYGSGQVIPAGEHIASLLKLPPEALRINDETIALFHKLGLHTIQTFFDMPRASLRKRFGQHLLTRLDQAVGQEMELLQPVQPGEPYQERLPCLEPIVTAKGIAIALEDLLKTLCARLQLEEKGIRKCIFNCYRVDGKMERIEIATNLPSYHVLHLMKLFEPKLSGIEPSLGIELFVLEAIDVEDHFSKQEKIWESTRGMEDEKLSELVDRISMKFGSDTIKRYIPAEHYWPERSYTRATTLNEPALTGWRKEKLRPLLLLPEPETIKVTAPIPDYPPMLFIHKGKRHMIVKADGPERIEQEWWIQQGQHRDYYCVEDENGFRYWLFRLGHYHDKDYKWFLHGYFS